MANPADNQNEQAEARTEPILTPDNLDAGMVYYIDVAPGIKGRGFITRMSSDPDDVEQDLPNTLRFFVFDPGEKNFTQFSLSTEEALQRNLRPARRKTAQDAKRLEQWLAVNYVKPEPIQ